MQSPRVNAPRVVGPPKSTLFGPLRLIDLDIEFSNVKSVAASVPRNSAEVAHMRPTLVES